jgi:hypothetical protein
MATQKRWEPISDMFRKPWLEGIAEGKADMLLKMLQLKGFVVTDEQRQRVLGCRDDALLDTWAARILVATRLDEVLRDD